MADTADSTIQEEQPQELMTTTNSKNDHSSHKQQPLEDITNKIKPDNANDDDGDVMMEDADCKDMSDGDSPDTATSPKIEAASHSPMDEDDAEMESATTATDENGDTEMTTAPADKSSPKKSPPPPAATENGNDDQPSAQQSDDEAYDGPTVDLAALMSVDDLSADQKKLMENRLGALQEEYKESVVRQRELRIQEIKNAFEFNVDAKITDQEASFIHDFCKKNQFDVMEKIEDEGVFFLTSIREMLEERKKQRARGFDAKKKKQKRRLRKKKRVRTERTADGEEIQFEDESGSEYEFGSDDSDDSDYCGSDLSDDIDDLLNGDSDVDGDGVADWAESAAERKERLAERRKRAANAKKGYKLSGEKRCGRLLLDDAMKDKNNKEGWSEARIKAFEQRESNPNSYYYRFNDPGQKQAGGLWDKGEQKLFMERLLELGANVRWGVFSMTIPGRVGYQCSNYYRQLVQTKQVEDPNYSMSGGKLTFRRGNLKDKNGNTYSRAQSEAYKQYAFIVKEDDTGVWKNLPARHPKCPKFALQGNDFASNDGDEEVAKPPKKAPKKGKKRRKKADDEDEEENAAPARKRRRTENSTGGGRKKKNKKDPDFNARVDVAEVDPSNPLPEMIDMITNLPVVQPAISPYGHVLGYATWTKILRQDGCKNTCPFTKQKLTRRQLTKLTHENIAEFKEQIVNVTAEEFAKLNLSTA